VAWFELAGCDDRLPLDVQRAIVCRPAAASSVTSAWLALKRTLAPKRQTEFAGDRKIAGEAAFVTCACDFLPRPAIAA
jgi:hypothetical protein